MGYYFNEFLENIMKPKKYMTVKEYSEKFKIPESTVYSQLKTKKLKGKKLGSYQLVEC